MTLTNRLPQSVGPSGDTTVALLGVFVALLLLPLQFYVSNVLVLSVPIVLGTASILYLAVRQYGHETATTPEDWHVGATGRDVFQLLVLFGLSGLVVTGWYTGGRAVPFFALAAVVGLLLFAQIFFLRESVLSPAAILAQLIAFALVVRITGLAMTPSTIGVDSWVHVPEYARSIYETGNLAAMSDSKYFFAPLYHLFVAVATQILGSTLQSSLYATLGLVVPVSFLLLYAAATYLLPVRWALFVAATYSVCDHFVRWGLHLIPTSVGLVFFILVFYGFARIYATGGSKEMYAFVVLVGSVTVFTHQISTFILVLFLGTGTAVQLIDRFGPQRLIAGTRSANFAGVFAIIALLTVIDWSITATDGESFLGGMLATALSDTASSRLFNLESATTVNNEAIASMVTKTPMWLQLLNKFGFLVLLFVTLVGIYTLLNRQNRELLPVVWIGTTGLLLFVTLGMPILGLYFFIPSRWYGFMYVPMVITAAFGLKHIETDVSFRKVAIVLLVFALVFPGAMLINNKATHDNPVADDHYQRFAFSDTELSAAETISEIHPQDAPLWTDHPYYLYLTDATGTPTEPFALNDDGSIRGDSVVYRTYQTTGTPVVTYDGETFRVKLHRDDVCSSRMSVLYTNGDVEYCRA